MPFRIARLTLGHGRPTRRGEIGYPLTLYLTDGAILWRAALMFARGRGLFIKVPPTLTYKLPTEPAAHKITLSGQERELLRESITALLAPRLRAFLQGHTTA